MIALQLACLVAFAGAQYSPFFGGHNTLVAPSKTYPTSSYLPQRQIRNSYEVRNPHRELPPPPHHAPDFFAAERYEATVFTQGTRREAGTLTFTVRPGAIQITGRLNLPPGAHAIHVHVKAHDQDGQCDTTGEHLKTKTVNYFGQEDSEGKTAVKGALQCDHGGNCYVNIHQPVTPDVTILNRGVVIHERPDAPETGGYGQAAGGYGGRGNAGGYGSRGGENPPIACGHIHRPLIVEPYGHGRPDQYKPEPPRPQPRGPTPNYLSFPSPLEHKQPQHQPFYPSAPPPQQPAYTHRREQRPPTHRRGPPAPVGYGAPAPPTAFPPYFEPLGKQRVEYTERVQYQTQPQRVRQERIHGNHLHPMASKIAPEPPKEVEYEYGYGYGSSAKLSGPHPNMKEVNAYGLASAASKPYLPNPNPSGYGPFRLMRRL